MESISALAQFQLAAAKSPNATAQKTKDAAQQFEALLISQLMKSARPDPDSASWLSTGESDESGSTAVEFAEEQFASAMAKSGGLGLANFIAKGLQKPDAKD